MSSPGDQDVYEAVLATVRAGRRAALATIVSTRGSTPRKAGSRMLVDPETGLVGTVGGGCGEAEVIEAAHEVIEDGVPRLVKVDLTEDLLGWSPAVCGGIMDIFVERVWSEGAPAASAPRESAHTVSPGPDGDSAAADTPA